MANSTFSNLSDRANGTFSNLRSRLSGGSSRGQERYSDGYDDYAYDDYRDYGEYSYGSDVGDPYDDIDDVSGIGEVRTRAASSSGRRYHPPLLSFDEARVNTYVPDHLLRDPLERTSRGSRAGAGAGRGAATGAGSGYTPRVRDSVNVGRAAEYDFAEGGELRNPAAPADATMPLSPADAPGDASATTAPLGSAARTAPMGAAARTAPLGASASDTAPVRPAASPAYAASAASPSYDPFASYQGAGAATHTPTRKLKLITPVSYGEVESVARALKAGDAVVLGLTRTPSELAKRILDFSFGVASALDARVDCVADKVFVVSRGHGLTDSERLSLHDQGIIL